MLDNVYAGVKDSAFVAKGKYFVNFTRPAKQQTVALRSGSDLSDF